MKKLPIGIENFKEIATDCYYVDKTLLIKELIDLPIGTSILFTRPCRFGKSLNLSMLQTYFEQGEDSRLYFEGKAIMSQEKSYLSEMSAHPVIRLVMKNAIGSDWATLYAKIKTIVASEYQRHCSLLDENVLSEQERRFFSSILDLSAPESDFSSALSQLALFLFRSSKKTVVVLLDEYDAPIEEARQNGFFDEAIAFFRSFYGEALKGNDSMRFAVVSGVMQIAKESLFSGLNNLFVANVTAPKYGEYFGFNEEETLALLSYYGKHPEKDELRKWYGGYSFGGQTLYNPWSILLYAQSGIFQPYWANTGKNSLIGSLIEKAPSGTIDAFNTLLSGGDCLCRILTSIDYHELTPDRDVLFSFLVAAGYLAIKQRIDGLMFKVIIPNQEIADIFASEIKDKFVPSGADEGYYRLKDALSLGDAEKLSSAFQEFLLSSFSSFEFGDEKNYQAMVLAMSALLFSDHIVKAEVNTGKGRCDILISPKTSGGMGIIMELKHYKNRSSSKRLIAQSQKALEQIKTLDYAEELHLRKANPIWAYGIVFYEKKAVIQSEKLQS